MATRIYLPSSGSAPVTPSTWNFPYQGATTYTHAGVLQKISSAFQSRTTATGTTSPRFTGVMRYVIGPLAAQTISGTVNLVMRASESSTGANATMGIAVKIIQSNGSDRAVLCAYTASDSATSTYELTTTLSTRRVYNTSEQIPVPLTSQSASAGDYLVIEIGFRSATTTSRNIVHRHGDSSANDCPNSNGNTSDYSPWVEFSGDIAWQMSLPTVTTQAATDATATSATGNGNITDRGGLGFCDVRGFVHGKSSQSDPGNVAPGSSGYTSYVQDTGSFSEGAFTKAISSLDSSSTYYIRAFTHNSAGYSYGSEQSFNTPAPAAAPTVTTQTPGVVGWDSATGRGNITVTGGENCDLRGFVYGTTGQSPPGNVAPGSSGYDGYSQASGSFGAGAFTGSITGLDSFTVHYCRAWAHNSGGYSYGDEVTFTTCSINAPAVTTAAASGVTSSEATLNGEITDIGYAPCTLRGFVFGTESLGDPGGIAAESSGYAGYTQESGSFDTGTFDDLLEYLDGNTTYYFRAYAYNDFYRYGSELSFTTLSG